MNLLSFAFFPCYFRLVLVSSSRSSVFMICRASLVLHCHVVCFYVGALYHICMMHLKCYDVVKRSFALCLFCLPFANRASVTGDLYIDFDRNHLIFPVACLVCQVTVLFIIFPSGAHICIAYHILHIIHVLHHVACAFLVVDCGSVCLCSCLG